MILYLHGFASDSASDHEKIMQLQFIDPDVRFINYSTVHPKHDMQFLLNEVSKHIELTEDKTPLICGLGLGGFWAERVGFLTGLKQVIFNPNLFPEENMQGRIDRPEEYADIATKCVKQFRQKNTNRCCVLLSKHDQVFDNHRSERLLSPYYTIIWDDKQRHSFDDISYHLQQIKAFKEI